MTGRTFFVSTYRSFNMSFLKTAGTAAAIGAVPSAPKGIRKKAGDIFFGSPERTESRLMDDQMPLYDQLQAALQGNGAGGAFGDAADYFRDLLSDDSTTFDAMSRPELRRFNEDIIPDLSEQFAGMGAGGLSSSGFRNAAVNAGTDLSERLASIRANLRTQGAQGLAGLGQQGLSDFKVIRPGTSGLVDSIGPAIGTAAGAYFGGPAGAAAGSQLGAQVSNSISGKGQTSPYGGQIPSTRLSRP